MKNKIFIEIDSEDMDEWLFSLEEIFDINFSDKELENIKQYGDLKKLIAAKLETKNAFFNVYLEIYLNLRRYFLSRFDINKKELKLNAIVSNVFPSNNVRKEWKEFNLNLKYKLPALAMNRFVFYFLLFVLLGILVSFFKFGFQIGIVGICLYILLAAVANYFNNTIKPMSLKYLIQYIAYHNFGDTNKIVSRRIISELIDFGMLEEGFVKSQEELLESNEFKFL